MLSSHFPEDHRPGNYKSGCTRASSSLPKASFNYFTYSSTLIELDLATVSEGVTEDMGGVGGIIRGHCCKMTSSYATTRVLFVQRTH